VRGIEESMRTVQNKGYEKDGKEGEARYSKLQLP
jgi:hypothetical protein